MESYAEILGERILASDLPCQAYKIESSFTAGRGVKAIANFLEMHPDKARKLIRDVEMVNDRTSAFIAKFGVRRTETSMKGTFGGTGRVACPRGGKSRSTPPVTS